MKILGHRLLTEGRQTEGVILELKATSGAPIIRKHVVVGFVPDRGKQVEFRQTISSAVNMPAANTYPSITPKPGKSR